MAELAALPPKLILNVVSFFTRKRILDIDRRLVDSGGRLKPELVPDLSSFNALAQTNINFHCLLDQTLYKLCASVEALGKLALLFAVEHQLKRAVDKLVAAGVSLDAEYLQLRGGQYACGLLHIAARMGLANMVSKLLALYGDSEEMNTKVYARAFISGTALNCGVLGGHLEVVKLLAPISGPSAGDSTHKQYLSVPLVESVKRGNTEIAKYLLLEGADANFRDNTIGPLCHALGASNLAMVQLLLSSGADPNIADQYGIPPLFKARTIDIAQALVDAGTNVNAQDDGGSNVLAYLGNDRSLLRFFLEQGVDPNHKDSCKQTPLHLACEDLQEVSVEDLELLLQFGAMTVEEYDKSGQTPVDIAMESGKAWAVKRLEPLVQNRFRQLKIANWLQERETAARRVQHYNFLQSVDTAISH
ncbi:ankyrin repeat-containing domain protein [Mycena sanguinolenta]|nr:ankyrin repeat-containing domain protein [Mycena sanguinolenta]